MQKLNNESPEYTGSIQQGTKIIKYINYKHERVKSANCCFLFLLGQLFCLLHALRIFFNDSLIFSFYLLFHLSSLRGLINVFDLPVITLDSRHARGS